MLRERGDIYLGEYEGWYSVADEAFVTEKELEALDEVTRSKVMRMREKSYFFRLSQLHGAAPRVLRGESEVRAARRRFNEVKCFVRSGLEISPSRAPPSAGACRCPAIPRTSCTCGSTRSPTTSARSAGRPSAASRRSSIGSGQANADEVHLVGKDILRFHAVYWPAFLMSAGIAPPTQVWAHGWLTVNGEKMSKRLGNFIPPGPAGRELRRRRAFATT